MVGASSRCLQVSRGEDVERGHEATATVGEAAKGTDSKLTHAMHQRAAGGRAYCPLKPTDWCLGTAFTVSREIGKTGFEETGRRRGC